VTRAPSNTKPPAISQDHIDHPSWAEQGGQWWVLPRQAQPAFASNQKPHRPAGQAWNEVDPANLSTAPLAWGLRSLDGFAARAGSSAFCTRRRALIGGIACPPGRTANPPAALSQARVIGSPVLALEHGPSRRARTCCVAKRGPQQLVTGRGLPDPSSWRSCRGFLNQQRAKRWGHRGSARP